MTVPDSPASVDDAPPAGSPPGRRAAAAHGVAPRRRPGEALWLKLVAAFLLVAVVGVAVVSVLANRATAAGFRLFLDANAAAEWSGLQASLADHYAAQGSWTGVAAVLAAVQPGRGQGSLGLALLDEDGQVVATAGGQRNRPASAAEADLALPILVNGRQRGVLLVRAPGAGAGRAGEQFLTTVNRAILWGGLAAVAAALILGALLARRLTRPLRQLTRATQQLATGTAAAPVPVTSRDELGDLAAGFNQMAAALAAAEQQRQQLLADVAHELRTPLSVMRSHMEAMLDGVFPLTAENLAVVHEESILLGRLVDDLRTLSLAEAGQLPLARAPVDLGALVDQAVAAFAPLAEAEQVQLTAAAPLDLPPVLADGDRIHQVLGNLLSNGLRHVRREEPSTPPRLQVTVAPVAGGLQVTVADNGPGLPPAALPHVFDRFWRADAARSRDRGGSGLGLAICQAIVQAHHGRIWVESTPGEGASFIFTLPLAAGA